MKNAGRRELIIPKRYGLRFVSQKKNGGECKFVKISSKLTICEIITGMFQPVKRTSSSKSIGTLTPPGGAIANPYKIGTNFGRMVPRGHRGKTDFCGELYRGTPRKSL